MEINLFEAWNIWINGGSLDGCVLFNLSMVWWARIGLMLQYVGALSVIIDIIGPDKINSFGKSLHSFYTFKDLKSNISEVKSWKKSLELATKGNDESIRRENLRKYNRNKITLITLILNITIMTYLYGILNQYITWFWSIILSFVAVLIISYWITNNIVLILLLIVNYIGYALDGLIFHPISIILRLPFLDKLFKILGLILISIGFHFDLLTS